MILGPLFIYYRRNNLLLQRVRVYFKLDFERSQVGAELFIYRISLLHKLKIFVSQTVHVFVTQRPSCNRLDTKILQNKLCSA